MSLTQLEKALRGGRVIPGKEKVVLELRGMVRVMQEMEGNGDGRAGDGNDTSFGGNRKKRVAGGGA